MPPRAREYRTRLPLETSACNGVDLPRRDLADLREVDAVFVTERQIAEQVFKRAQPALAQAVPRGAVPRL